MGLGGATSQAADSDDMVSASKSCSASGAKSAPLGQTTVPQIESNVTLPK
jgi:hypothetical protein